MFATLTTDSLREGPVFASLTTDSLRVGPVFALLRTDSLCLGPIRCAKDGIASLWTDLLRKGRNRYAHDRFASRGTGLKPIAKIRIKSVTRSYSVYSRSISVLIRSSFGPFPSLSVLVDEIFSLIIAGSRGFSSVCIQANT